MDEQHASKYVNCDHERVRFQGFLSMTGQVHKPKTDKQVLSRGHLSFFQLSCAPSYADAMKIFDRSAFLRLVDIEFCDFIGLEKCRRSKLLLHQRTNGRKLEETRVGD